jgi:putative ABC transport system ATP-binding protein
MLTVRDLTIEYVQAGYVVRPIAGLDTTATDGELVILLGPSGSGKTTLLSCIAALLRPAGGSIEVDGTEVTGLGGAALSRYRRETVGIVFQAFNLVPSLTARENVASPLFLTGVSRRKAYARAEELLDRVGLADRAGHLPARMSGGQQQRVAIARALVRDPPLILADEPTAHLDHVQVEGVLHLLRDLAAPGRVVVVATHDDRFNPLADRVIDLAPRAADGAAASKAVELVAGEVLFEQGDPSDLVYVVDAGGVEVFRRRPQGGEDVLAQLGPGNWFGELGPLVGLPRSASVRAREQTRLTGMGVQEFRRWRARA